MRREIISAPEARLSLKGRLRGMRTQQPGLGDRFEAEIHATLRRILQNPERFRLVGSTVRKARVQIFPYNVYYHVEDDFIGVVSVFHGKRDPAELRRRIK